MWARWLARLWQIAQRFKEASEWWGLLVAFGVAPTVPVMLGFLEGQPPSLIALYVVVAIAFWVVLVAEGAPLIAGLRRADPEKQALREEVARLRREREDQAANLVDPGLLTSRVTIRLSGPAYEIVHSENVAAVLDAGVVRFRSIGRPRTRTTAISCSLLRTAAMLAAGVRLLDSSACGSCVLRVSRQKIRLR